MALDKDPLDVALEIKRGFARTVASKDKPAGLEPGYLLGVAVWWLVAFGGLSIIGRWRRGTFRALALRPR